MRAGIQPIALIILDGFGHSEQQAFNAIANAQTPTWDHYWADGKAGHSTLISSSGKAVGLPEGQMGNSEVGHMTLGSGRILHQDLTRIDQAIEDKSFFENAAFKAAIEKSKKARGAIHIIGLCSNGGVHSHIDHMVAAIEMAEKQGANNIILHTFLDGRDVPPKSALSSLQKIERALSSTKAGQIASLCGRFFAMDRDNRWDRVQAAYDLLTQSTAMHYCDTAENALEAAYHRGETDEFVQPTWIGDSTSTIQKGDSVIFINFRADRARQLTRCFVENKFDAFIRQTRPSLADFVSMTQYAEDFDTSVAFSPLAIHNDLGEIIANKGLKQLRIAETEKYAHVTFFFSGGKETPYDGENRVLIPSPDVKTYDLQPEMSADELTDQFINAIRTDDYSLIVCNYANCDMVGHTGNYEASVKAVEKIDECLKRVIEAAKKVGMECLITADHGNCETMVHPETGQPLTSHTTCPVPLVYSGQDITLKSGGRLCDVAPTVLTLMGIDIPQDMTGHSLLESST